MPRTRPRSTAQITGCSMAAPPKGQWSDTMRRPSPWRSAWAANPWAVRASATVCRAVRNDRCASLDATAGSAQRRRSGRRRPSTRPSPGRTRARPPRPWPRRCRSGSSDSALPSSVTSRSSWRTGQLEGHLRRRHAVALRWAPGAGAVASGGDLDVAAAGQLVEVVAGHVGVEREALGHLAGGDAGARARRRRPSLRSWTKR